MNKALSEFLVGLTVLLGLLGVSVLLLMFGEISGAGVGRFVVFLRIADASGLSTASGVTLNGVSIGSINAIRSDADPRSGVVIELAVNQGVCLPRDVSVELERGLVGEATLSLRASPLAAGAADPGCLGEGETLSSSATGMMDRISALLEDKLSMFEGAAEEFKSLAASFGKAGDRLNDALAPRTPSEVDAGAPANLTSTVARIDEAVKGAQGWLGDEALRGDAKSAVAKLNEILDKAASAVESWNAAAATLTTRADELSVELASAARALGETAHEVQAIAAKINRGEGTAGMLVNNPDLYRNLNDAATRLEKALTEAQLLLEKYRKEGLPVRF